MADKNDFPDDVVFTNRLSIERKKICEKCGNEGYYDLYIDGDYGSYCCKKCAEKYQLIHIQTLLQ